MKIYIIKLIVISVLVHTFAASAMAAETTKESAAIFLKSLTREVQQKSDIRVKVDDVLAMKSKGEALTLIDVRTEQERSVVGIPKSLAIPIDKIMENLDKIPRDHKVVMVCHSGPRSVIAATVLRMLGYDNVYALNGGIHALADVTAKTAPEIKAAIKEKPTEAVKKQAAEEEYSELGGDNFSCD